ncbi:MAG: hypothetical protein IT495_00940 [Gammaproteobacteria bacterium]|nr:hypothetical protein [Gammaproteobacteria bacterium]
MDIKFAEGAAGYHEARELKDMTRCVVENTVSGSHDRQLLDYLERTASALLERPEFESLRRDEPPPVEDRPPWRRLGAWLRQAFGPSRRELAMARQRSEALARAERAERSAFEALAETARVGRERDEALQRLAELQARLEGSAGAD